MVAFRGFLLNISLCVVAVAAQAQSCEEVSRDFQFLLCSGSCCNEPNIVSGGFHPTNAGMKLPPLQW
jgi:hypothetical protein